MASRQVTAGDLIERAKEAADLQNQRERVVTPDEALRYVNLGLNELHNVILMNRDDWIVATTQPTLTGSLFQLPDDHASTRGVWRYDPSSGLPTTRLDRFEKESQGSGWPTVWSQGCLMWNVENDIMKFFPLNSVPGDVVIEYLPTVTELASSGSLLPRYATLHGFDDFIVQDVAARMLDKKEMDNERCLRRKAEVLQRIQTMAGRDETGRRTVQRIRTRSYDGMIYGRSRFTRRGDWDDR